MKKYKRKIIIFLIVFLIILLLSSSIGSQPYDPYVGQYPKKQSNFTMDRPIGGLIQTKYFHPWWTPVILLNNKDVNGNNVFSQLQLGWIYSITIPYWIIISIIVTLFVDRLFNKKKV